MFRSQISKRGTIDMQRFMQIKGTHIILRAPDLSICLLFLYAFLYHFRYEDTMLSAAFKSLSSLASASSALPAFAPI